MDLTCRLSPLVYAELYSLLAENGKLADGLDRRLNEIDLDLEWLGTSVTAYNDHWASSAQWTDGNGPDHRAALSEDHALLASWLLASLRNQGPCDDLSRELTSRVADRRNREVPQVKVFPSSLEPRIIAWTLGMVVGRFDVNFPVVPAQMPVDHEVELAYRGFVEHIVHLGEIPDPWPEVMCSSTLWRAAGLAEGLRPDANGPDEAINHLMVAIRQLTPAHQYERLRKHWIGFVSHRNALTHVAPKAGQPRFSDAVNVARASEHVAPTVLGITSFVFEMISTELSGPASGAVYPGLWDQLKYEIGAF